MSFFWRTTSSKYATMALQTCYVIGFAWFFINCAAKDTEIALKFWTLVSGLQPYGMYAYFLIHLKFWNEMYLFINLFSYFVYHNRNSKNQSRHFLGRSVLHFGFYHSFYLKTEYSRSFLIFPFFKMVCHDVTKMSFAQKYFVGFH